VRTRGAATVWIILIVLAACAGAKDSAAAHILMQPVGGTVTLLDPGSSPRVSLRLHPVKGNTYDVTMLLNLQMAATVSGNSFPNLALPALTMTMRAKVSNVTTSGTTVDLSFRSLAGVHAFLSNAPALEQALTSAEGLRARLSLNDAGIVTAVGFASTDSALLQSLTQFGQQLAGLSIPLPDEPVGKGARWTTTTPALQMTLSGVTLHQRITYIVEDVAGNQVRLQILSEAEVPDQISTFPDLPAGASLHLHGSTVKGGGVALDDLRQPFPLTMDQANSGTLVMDPEGLVGFGRMIATMSTDAKITSSKV